MKIPSLIQRLREPSGNAIAWAFPGTRTGGFSDKQIEILTPILTFDYMGASEFEWGEVRNAFDNVYSFFSKGIGAYGEVNVQKPVYYLSSNLDEKQVQKFLGKLAQNGDGIFSFERPTHFKEALEKTEPSDKYGGWIELANPFMFFTDEKIYHGIKDLFSSQH